MTPNKVKTAEESPVLQASASRKSSRDMASQGMTSSNMTSRSSTSQNTPLHSPLNETVLRSPTSQSFSSQFMTSQNFSGNLDAKLANLSPLPYLQFPSPKPSIEKTNIDEKIVTNEYKQDVESNYDDDNENIEDKQQCNNSKREQLSIATEANHDIISKQVHIASHNSLGKATSLTSLPENMEQRTNCCKKCEEYVKQIKTDYDRMILFSKTDRVS